MVGNVVSVRVVMGLGVDLVRAETGLVLGVVMVVGVVMVTQIHKRRIEVHPTATDSTTLSAQCTVFWVG